MRLALKIALAILFGVGLLLSLHSYQSVQREKEILKENLSREARQIGQVLRFMMSEIWQARGEQAARAFLARSDSVNDKMQIGWAWLKRAEAEHQGIPQDQLKMIFNGEIVTLLQETPSGADSLTTYIPLRIIDDQAGTIEIVESLEDLHGYIRETMRRSAMLMAAIVGCSLLVIIAIGSLWVSEPVKRLAAQADRIAAGDFSHDLKPRGNDDFATLTSAIDRMRHQLAAAKKADQERLETLEKLRHTERLATLGRLSAGMAHELGTPLNVISGRAKLIASQQLSPEESTKSASIIGEQAERMTALMRQLLDFARRGTPQKVEINLQQLAQYVLTLLRPTAEHQKVILSCSCDDESIRSRADNNQLQQVLLNLVMNGIQAMPDGGALQIAVDRVNGRQHPEQGATEPGDYARISVSDSGSGIDPEHLPQLFDPFFTTKDVGQGSGLGLSIAYGIVQEHGGWIEVSSEPGSGSRFDVYLPLSAQPEETSA